MCVNSALLGSSGLGSARATTVCPFSNRALAGMSPSSFTSSPPSSMDFSGPDSGVIKFLVELD